jgi:hypothetical protein
MQVSRALIAMLILIASAFAPVLSTPIELECVVVPIISCDTADPFVVLVAPKDSANLIVYTVAHNPK